MAINFDPPSLAAISAGVSLSALVLPLWLERMA
jgi:hypothetical protein